MEKENNESLNLDILCENVRISVKENNPSKYLESVKQAMSLYPHSGIPHNLMGIILEYMGKHPMAMCHFRASYALDPSFMPARLNLESFGTFYTHNKCAYTESDCNNDLKMRGYEKVRDSDGVYHFERKFN